MPSNKETCAGRSGIAVCFKGKDGENRKKRKMRGKCGGEKATSRYEVTSAIVLFLGLLIFYIKADSLEYFIFLMKRDVKFHNFL